VWHVQVQNLFLANWTHDRIIGKWSRNETTRLSQYICYHSHTSQPTHKRIDPYLKVNLCVWACVCVSVFECVFLCLLGCVHNIRLAEILIFPPDDKICQFHLSLFFSYSVSFFSCNFLIWIIAVLLIWMTTYF
jgi:hypothetical protein